MPIHGVITQFDWLMRHLEPMEALELRAAKDALMSRHLDEQKDCPLFAFNELVAANLTISEVLSAGFIWDRTPQGKDYWEAVHNKYRALESMKRNKEKDNDI